ncbi:Lar family restriction alleviation protein [Desulfobacterota bacterium M19]
MNENIQENSPTSAVPLERIVSCPFCGSEDVLCVAFGGFKGHRVCCHTCDAAGPVVDIDTKKEAIRAWNKRRNQWIMLKCISDLCRQYLSNVMNSDICDPDYISAGEQAQKILVEYGFAEIIDGYKFKLLDIGDYYD